MPNNSFQLIFELSKKDRQATAQAPLNKDKSCIPSRFLRNTPLKLPEVSELDTVRHYTRLSRLNFSIDTHFYPLGSCTMKYNPRGIHRTIMNDNILMRHPLAPEQFSQGYMQSIHELQETLTDITGMKAVSLTPMAGAQGELAGVLMIRAYHASRGDHSRDEFLVPDAAHGTNPATATLCGYKVREIPTDSEGNVDIKVLKKFAGAQTAGIMLTNPSTLGVFEQKIGEISKIIHNAGGLLYYDGANLNAILGKVRPGDMGFDVMHMNLHKTFATPHGGGGPGSGPVAANEKLAEFLPIPMMGKNNNSYYWINKSHRPHSIGRLSTFMGNAGILLRALMYTRLLGEKGLKRVAEFATLNACYLQTRLKKAGFNLAYPNRRACHEFIISLKNEASTLNVTALDVAKRLLDFGFHAPTMYFPLLVPECLLIEPTETESKQTLDKFIESLTIILNEAKTNPDIVRTAPHNLNICRLDEVRAARMLDLTWQENETVT